MQPPCHLRHDALVSEWFITQDWHPRSSPRRVAVGVDLVQLDIAQGVPWVTPDHHHAVKVFPNKEPAAVHVRAKRGVFLTDPVALAS
jgi:hypothetical protein